ncbi:MAG: MBL fold metallo-hydrolase [Acidobacteriota bacterium]
MILETAAAPPFFKNGYVLGCERTREAVYIDPGDEVEALLAFLTAERLTLTAVLLTHAHVDHVSGLAEVRRRFRAPIWLHRDDLFLFNSAPEHARLFGLSIETPPPPDRFYEGPGPLAFGDYDVTVHHTPGHSPGGVCLQVGRRGKVGRHLFVGDTLFQGSIGRTDLPGGDYATLMRSITGVLLPLGDDARVFSGHGPETTIAAERKTNPFILDWLSKGGG